MLMYFSFENYDFSQCQECTYLKMLIASRDIFNMLEGDFLPNTWESFNQKWLYSGCNSNCLFQLKNVGACCHQLFHITNIVTVGKKNENLERVLQMTISIFWKSKRVHWEIVSFVNT